MSMTKDELEQYARENRKRLAEQEVKLGDVVRVLVGPFAGEKGVIVGIIACCNDYTDPYYEVDMACEVPDKYKCRKTLITPNNVVGGFTACNFEVIGNRVPKQPTDEIKCGDIVKVKRETPKDLYNNLPHDMPFFVAEIERDCDNPMNDTFLLRNGRTCLNIHPHWLEKWDAKTQPNGHTTTFPVKADLDDTYWDAYRAELASKIAVAYAEKGRYKPSEIGEFAVMVANDVVDNLKNKKV